MKFGVILAVFFERFFNAARNGCTKLYCIMAKFFPLPILLALLFFSCGKTTAPTLNKLEKKSRPYDLFAFQRSYPDPEFDWKAWRQTLQQTRQTETVLARGSGGCDGNQSPWTLQGPMNVAGRCNSLAIKPDDENTVLAGFSGGGIFKSTDGAVNWHPVFDDNPELAIGHITFDPSNPNIVYAGTGDPNVPSIVFNGDGIYKSFDAGESWQHLPNSPSGIISKVIVHPTQPSTVWAAVMGNPYTRDNHRGIYKSIDGGNTWTQVLFVSNQTGASSLVQSPANPQILYASFWDRLRNNFESVVYGPNAKVYKSTDGGNTWALLGGGLPTGVMGRTGLAISQTNPDKVYAVYIDSLSTPGGLFKTTDGGNTWTPINIVQLKDACADFGWFFGKIHLNPNNDEEVFFHAILLWRKGAGSNSWFNAAGGHADSHDLVFAPSGRRYWANDGGVYRNNPGQSSWTKSKNLPTTQFYRTTFNPHAPNQYWAGAQDNGIQKGSGADINNWTPVFAADGFNCAFDPFDPNHFWVEIQNGTIHETTDGGASWIFGSAALGTSDRTNWDTPFFMSKHTPNQLYAATHRAYTKVSGGGWGSISGDLTDGNILGARFHNVSCLNESPVTPNKLVAGTSDGNVWRREPNGTWTNLTAGLPDRYVTSVHYSPTLSNRIYVSHSGFRDNENIPHIHRSNDNGNTWQDISSDLPPIPVNDLLILPGHDDQVIFAATDAGVYFTLNAGTNWARLGGNMPYIPVFDLERNPVRNELVAATFARGIWTFPFDSVFVQQAPVAVSLSGTVLDEMGQGVIEVSFNGNFSQANGNFSLQNIPGCAPYTLTPYRNDNPLNGLTTYDLVLISQHILGTQPFDSPLKMIAADANRSGSITSFDIVQLRKIILGVDTAFVNNTSWRFVPADYVFPNPQNPFAAPFPESLAVQVLTDPLANLDFTAIKVGDVNNTAAPSFGSSADERSLGLWPMEFAWLSPANQPTISVASGARAEVVVSFSGTQPVASQFTLQFDAGQMAFEGWEPLSTGISADNFGLNRTANGLLSFAHSVHDGSIPDGAPLFKLAFRAKRDMTVSDLVRLVDWPTPALAYTGDGTAHRPVLARNDTDTTPLIFPNPFGKSGFWVKTPATETLEIYDAQGKVLLSQKLRAGETTPIEAGIFKSAGVYYWRMGGQAGKLVFTAEP